MGGISVLIMGAVMSAFLFAFAAAIALFVAALFLVPGVVLMGGEWLPELLDFTPYVRWWEAPLRLLLVCALCWGWIWTEGSVFQIALALLLWFCIGWALCLLLRIRRIQMTP